MKLTDPVTSLPFVGDVMGKNLKKLAIYSISDLLHHVPSRYSDFSRTASIQDLRIGDMVTVEGQIISLKNIYTKTGKVMQEGVLSDGENTIYVIWFRQVYLVKTLPPGTMVALTGKVGFWGKKKAITAPSYEKIVENKELLHSGRIVPVYPETAGITSKWLRRLVNEAISRLEVEDFLSSKFLSTHQLLPLVDGFKKVHAPQDLVETEVGRTRLAFNELLGLEIAQRQRRREWLAKSVAMKLSVTNADIFDFLAKIPFTPTSSQSRSMGELAQELSKEIPMNRLLEGDVGSGKTLVAAFAAYVAAKNNVVTLIMAPTQILATQHEKVLKELLAPFGIPVNLVTAREKTKTLKERGVYVGTQALLFKLISKEVGLVVIDEQHRFGVGQRSRLAELGTQVPHILTMTATPIPRTIALTLYGDLSLSTLDELPKGRIPIKTWVVTPKKRDSAYEWVKKEIEEHEAQVFVVCPLIDESENEKMKEVKSATVEYNRLKKLFPKKKIALLHGKMKSAEKDAILADFKDKKYDILVSTPVVEVGIDIPNATIMVIEAADRFGLAALHQLRGRVGRGSKQSYCLLMSENTSEKVQTRLTAMSKTLSGRELAELDLSLRGPGEIFGTKQSGLPELKIARWTDIDLIKKVKQSADEVINTKELYEAVMEYFKAIQKAAN